jgi:hypothetical protein
MKKNKDKKTQESVPLSQVYLGQFRGVRLSYSLKIPLINKLDLTYGLPHFVHWTL